MVYCGRKVYCVGRLYCARRFILSKQSIVPIQMDQVLTLFALLRLRGGDDCDCMVSLTTTARSCVRGSQNIFARLFSRYHTTCLRMRNQVARRNWRSEICQTSVGTQILSLQQHAFGIDLPGTTRSRPRNYSMRFPIETALLSLHFR